MEHTVKLLRKNKTSFISQPGVHLPFINEQWPITQCVQSLLGFGMFVDIVIAHLVRCLVYCDFSYLFILNQVSESLVVCHV